MICWFIAWPSPARDRTGRREGDVAAKAGPKIFAFPGPNPG
jgi:hypothetical protein